MKKIMIVLMVVLIIITGCSKDNEPPVVSITNPQDNSILNGIVEIIINATDNKNVSEVEIYIDDSLVLSDNSSPYSYLWNTTVYDDNTQHKIFAKAYDENDNLGISDTVNVTILNPPVPSKPTGPVTGLVNTSYDFSSVALDPRNDSVSIRFYWGNGDTSNWSSFFASGDTIKMNYSWSIPDTYFVKCQAKDKNNAISSWSDSAMIIIQQSSTNNPPVPQTPTGPTTGYVNTSYSFTSTAQDPEGDSISLRFSWGDGDTSNWSSFVPNNSNVSLNHTWTNTGYYDIKVQAKDKNGAISGWSGSLTIQIQSQTNSPPNKPSIYGSTDCFLNYTYQYSFSAHDPDGDSVSIMISWGNGDTTFWTPFIPSDSVITFNRVWSNTGNYPIYAQAKDKNGNISGWSDKPLSVSVMNVTPGQKKWSKKISNALYGIAIDNDGTLYIGGYETLYAVTQNGSIKWRHGNFIWWGLQTPAIGPDGTIYISCYHTLYAVNPDGTRKWSFFGTPHGISDLAIGQDGTIYVNYDGASMYAVNPDGSTKWVFNIQSDDILPPVIGSDGTIYTGDPNDSVYAVNPDGTKKWAYGGIYADIYNIIIADDGTVYYNSGYSSVMFHFVALTPNGTFKWKRFSVLNPSIGPDGTIYCYIENSTCDSLAAINPDGTLKWSTPVPSGYWINTHSPNPLVGNDGMIYFIVSSSSSDKLLAVNPNGTINWTYNISGDCFNSPIIAPDELGNGVLYVTSNDGMIYAIFCSSTDIPNSQWPTYQHDKKRTGRKTGP